MRTDTEELIARIVADARPVRRLAAPWTRAALWLLLSLPFVAAVVLWHGSLPGLARLAADPRFLVEMAATALTAALAAAAAFAAVVPGAKRGWLLAPLVPLAVWLGAVGQGCVADWRELGPAGLALRIDWGCFVPMVAVGLVPAAAMVAMLRHGAPVAPRLALALSGVAVAALANLGLQLFHVADVSLMVLVWHLGAVALLSAVAALSAPHLLRWPASTQFGTSRALTRPEQRCGRRDGDGGEIAPRNCGRPAASE